jgi:hypothetical protein
LQQYCWQRRCRLCRCCDCSIATLELVKTNQTCIIQLLKKHANALQTPNSCSNSCSTTKTAAAAAALQRTPTTYWPKWGRVLRTTYCQYVLSVLTYWYSLLLCKPVGGPGQLTCSLPRHGAAATVTAAAAVHACPAGCQPRVDTVNLAVNRCQLCFVCSHSSILQSPSPHGGEPAQSLCRPPAQRVMITLAPPTDCLTGRGYARNVCYNMFI